MVHFLYACAMNNRSEQRRASYLLPTLIEVECWHTLNLTGRRHILSEDQK